jgi:pSer/pThr/pTyr-binding forkhead associated (FHA) protein
VIPHASVSRTHARLMKRDGAYELTDLNSTNGSFVDERQVRGSAMVSNGSQLRLGDIRFVLRY